MRVASPKGFELPAAIQESVARRAPRPAGRLELTNDPVAAVGGADAVYTDVWASMGQEDERRRTRSAFRAVPGQRRADGTRRRGALFMHCLPAHRGDEVTDEVIDSAASVVFDQAENRLHTQKALLAMLTDGGTRLPS